MLVERRISASFKDIPGGQILGSTTDYTHRLLDFSLVSETRSENEQWIKQFMEQMEHEVATSGEVVYFPKVVD